MIGQQVVVRNYQGQPGSIRQQYAQDAQTLGAQGYEPVATSSIRQPRGCLWNLIVGWNVGLFMRAPEVMTVTYRLAR